MKRYMLMILTVMMAMVCLTAAGAEEDLGTIVEMNYGVWTTKGETYATTWPDFLSKVGGKNLKYDDFDITYTFSAVNCGLSINEDWTITAAEDAKSTDVKITFTPKVAGRGRKTTFTKITIWVYDPIRDIVFEDERVILYKDQKKTVHFSTGSDFRVAPEITYDESVVKIERNYKYSGGDDDYWYDVTAVGVGSTKMVATAYNGVTASIPVTVLADPTKLTFDKSVYYGREGEAIDLGTDFGNGSVALEQDASVFVNGSYQFVSTFFKTDFAHFSAPAGIYDLTLTSKNGYEASARIYVYSRSNCVDLVPKWPNMKEREDNNVYAHDAKGNKLTLPMKITQGNEFASLEGDRLITTGYGTIEITVTNPDGSTYAEQFEILPNPTEIILNATELTLEVGESFQLVVGFDKGTAYYQIEQDHTYDEKYGIEPTRIQDQLITAQNPGTTVYTVKVDHGRIEKTLTVTVPESEKAVHIVLPPEPFGVGHSYQMYVRDGNGKVVSAAFGEGKNNAYSGKANLTAGGYITGVGIGTYELCATLADGRVLTRQIYISQIPAWIRIDAVVVRKSDQWKIVAESDVGSVTNMTYQIANTSIIKIEDGIIKPKKTGKTTVTATSVTNPEVSTTFTVKVISDTSRLYVGSTNMSIPYGSTRYMPIVTDSDGDEVPMKWEITHNNPGQGNPEKSGFKLNGNEISCTWPDASCEVTGTVKGSNEYVVVTVKAYTLPENIAINPVQVWLEPGETQQLTLTTEDDCGGWGVVLWAADVDGVVNVPEYTDGKSNTIKAVAPGTAIVAAMLENGAVTGCIVNVYDTNQRLPGDVNEDGAVNAEDALIIMQYDAGWPVLINGWQGDVNADGKTNLSDAVMIFQHAAGLEVELRQYIPGE